MSRSLTVSEARAALPDIIDRVLQGEEVTLTRHGVEVAVVVRPDVLRVRRADEVLASAATIRDLLDRGRRSRLSDHPVISSERSAELIAELRVGRSSR
jgi:antitoxin (DNA-binding transcriptional repressor) of toxin-antitoxin stability system